MGEESGTRLNRRSAACKFPSESIREKQLLRPRRIIVAMSLAVILTTTSLVYYLMLPKPLPFSPFVYTQHAPIEIDGDADLSETALLEGWPGDGSPEDPFIIDALEIDLGGGRIVHCIGIHNTRVSFIIRNCNLTGAHIPRPGWEPPFGNGICLYNVTNAELVNNTCNNNEGPSISLWTSHNNTVLNNACNSNGGGIEIHMSKSNTVANNTCNDNSYGISLSGSDYNTVENNTCNSNDIGIEISESDYNTVANNTCNNNRIGIYLDDESYSNTVANNTEHDTPGEYMTEEDETEEFDPGVLPLIGFAGIIVLGAAWKLLSGIRESNRGI